MERKWGTGHNTIAHYYEVCPEWFLGLLEEHHFVVTLAILCLMGGQRSILAQQKTSVLKQPLNQLPAVRDVQLDTTEEQCMIDVDNIRTGRLRVTIGNHKKRRV